LSTCFMGRAANDPVLVAGAGAGRVRPAISVLEHRSGKA
jgi:hypothetical protein